MNAMSAKQVEPEVVRKRINGRAEEIATCHQLMQTGQKIETLPILQKLEQEQAKDRELLNNLLACT